MSRSPLLEHSGPILLLCAAFSAVLGLAFFLARSVMAGALYLVGLEAPSWAYPLFVVGATGSLILFPSLSGRFITFAARQFGLVALKVEKADWWRLTFDGLTFETKEWRVSIRSLVFRLRRDDYTVEFKVCGGHIEACGSSTGATRSAAAAADATPGKQPSSSTKAPTSSPSSKRQQRRPNIDLILRMVQTVFIECDALTVEVPTGTLRLRDVSLAVQMSRDRKDRKLSSAARMQTRLSIGMFSFMLGSRQDQNDLSTMRLGETDDLFPEGQESATPKLASTSFRQLTEPPMVEASHLEFLAHAADNSLATFVPGVRLMFGSIRITASSNALVKLAPSSLSGNSAPSPVAPATATLPTKAPLANRLSSLLESMTAWLQHARADPTVVTVPMCILEWRDHRGALAVSNFGVDCELNASGVVRAAFAAPSLKVEGQSMLDMDSLVVEMLNKPKAVCVGVTIMRLNGTIRPTHIEGLEKAHLEVLRTLSNIKNNYGPASPTLVPVSALPPPSSAVGPLPSPTSNRMALEVDFSLVDGLSLHVEHDPEEPTLSMEVNTVTAALDAKDMKLQMRDAMLRSDTSSLLSISFVNLSRADLKLEKVALVLAAGSIVRAAQAWTKYEPRLARWKDAADAVQALHMPAPTKKLRPQSFDDSSRPRRKIIVNGCDLACILAEDTVLSVSVPLMEMEPGSNLNIAKTFVNVKVQNQEYRILSILRIQALKTSEEIHVGMADMHFYLPRTLELGKVANHYFTQRKALLLVMPALSKPGAAAEAKEEAPEPTPIHFHLGALKVELEDDAVPDSPAFKSVLKPERFVHPGSPALLFTLADLKVRATVYTAWKSKAGPNSDSSLLKRSSAPFSAKSSALRTRAKLLKILYDIDVVSMPLHRLELALSHGFADLILFQVASLDCGALRLSLFDHPLPMLAADSLRSIDHPCTVLFADLRACPASSRPIRVTLTEVGHVDRRIIVDSSQSSIPMKAYFDARNLQASNVRLVQGECFTPSLIALDRALGRLLPASSDSTSPRLGWWDKLRYLSHGRSGVECHGFEMRQLVVGPHNPNECVLWQATHLFVSDLAEGILPPQLGMDVRGWGFKISNMVLTLLDREKQYKLVLTPRLRFVLSMTWSCPAGGDHYVPMHFPEADKAVPDIYRDFASRSLSLWIDFESSRASPLDYSVQDNVCPGLCLNWRAMYPLLCVCYRGLVPPGLPVTPPTSPSLSRILSEITFTVRSERPHVLWWEESSSQTAILLRGRKLDSRVQFVKSSEGKWVQDGVLAQFAAVEAFILHRMRKTAMGPPVQPCCWGEEFGLGEQYVFGVGLPLEPFYSSPAMRLTLGAWGLMNDVESSAVESKSAYRLVVDEMRLFWTLSVRDETFRLFGTVAYVVRKEAREHAKILRSLNVALAFAVAPERQRKIATALTHRRERARTKDDTGMSTKMATLLAEHGVSGSFPLRASDSAGVVHVEDRLPVCSSDEKSADGFANTLLDSCRDYTIELRWPQVCLQTARTTLVLSGTSTLVRAFRLSLMDGSVEQLTRKEIDVKCEGVRCFACTLDESGATRWVTSARPPDAPYAISSEFDTKFISGWGTTRKAGTSAGVFTDRVYAAAFPTFTAQNDCPSDALGTQLLLDARIKKRTVDGASYDSASTEQDPALKLVAWADSFQVTDVVYTDVTGGVKVPPAYLGMSVPSVDARIRSHDFFAVLIVIRDLLLVAPPPDVKELAELALQEARAELNKSKDEADTAGKIESTTAVGDTRALYALVESIVLSRPPRIDGEGIRQQTIAYEVGKAHMVLSEDSPDMPPRVVCEVTRLLGRHVFALDASTSVEFQVGTLSLKDASTGTDVVEWAVLDKASTPFLRAEAITSAPIHTTTYNVSVYELLQVNLFPGARYTLGLRVSKDLASFVRRYFTEDDEDDEPLPSVEAVRPMDSDDDAEEALVAGGDAANTSNSAAVPSVAAKMVGDRHSSRFSALASIKGLFASSSTSAPGILGGGGSEDAYVEDAQGEDARTVVVRSGWVLRLSVPKQLQLHPEPTVQPWANTKVRRNFLLLISRPRVGAALELHRNDIGVKLFVPPRALVVLADVVRIRRSKDPAAPPHALDLVYQSRPGPGMAGGEGVFTLAAEEAGWSGPDAALPWVAALSPGLKPGVVDPDLQAELASRAVDESLAAIIRRSARFLAPSSHARSSFEDDLDDDDENGHRPPSESSMADDVQLVPHALGGAGGKEDFHAELESALISKTKEPRDFTYFKYVRVGQIQLDLVLMGFAYINSVQRAAMSRPLVMHRRLLTWTAAFKEVRTPIIKELFLSAVNPMKAGREADTPTKEEAPTVHRSMFQGIRSSLKKDAKDTGGGSRQQQQQQQQQQEQMQLKAVNDADLDVMVGAGGGGGGTGVKTSSAAAAVASTMARSDAAKYVALLGARM